MESGRCIQPEGEKLFLLLCQKSSVQIKAWIGSDWIGLEPWKGTPGARERGERADTGRALHYLPSKVK